MGNFTFFKQNEAKIPLFTHTGKISRERNQPTFERGTNRGLL